MKQRNRLIIAAYRLPFKFSKTKKGIKAIQHSGGLVSAILALSERPNGIKNEKSAEKIKWVGISDTVLAENSNFLFENENFDICPVNIPTKINDLYYGGFCNDLIWPLFHYFPSYSVFNMEYFKAYQEANALFCNEIVKILKPGDFVWIHDYQLFLLPEMIRKIIPDAKIGFFLHIPFPSFEIFRLLPRFWRESIIKGMLGSDLIGFHTHDYTQHFIKSVKRTTGFECRQNVIYSPNKLTKADAFPIGIDYDKFHSACLEKSVVTEKNKIRKELPNQKLIFSVDRLDYSKGLLLRLKGYETFLEKYPKWHSKVVFNMVVVPSRDNIKRYEKMKKEIESTVGRINGKYSSLSWRPIIYQYKSLSFHELVALYDLSDVGLITPLRDGMNLVAKEYVACQIENKGVLILSEMAGAAAELSEALLINPADNHEMSEAVYAALEMASEEKNARLDRMQQRLSSYNVFTWAQDFFNQANEIKEQQNKMIVKLLNKTVALKIKLDYQNSTKRILLLDYDGTLVSIAKYPELATIDFPTLEIIKKLAEDHQNTITIISGRDKDFLDGQFKDVKVTLVAEHGFFIKKPGESWLATVDTTVQWKPVVLPILTQYVSRCHGSFIEEKTGSIAWHYRNTDADFAQLRLNELRDDLTEIIRHKTDFEILEGNKVLEVKSSKYDKGQAVNLLLKNQDYNFIFAAGDDKTDEAVFKVLPNNAHSLRIGLNHTLAKYNIPDNSFLIKLLKSFTD